ARLGKSVFVGNAGAHGASTLNMAYLLREYKDEDLVPPFDWVVALCGVDDWGNELTYAEAVQLQHIRELPITTTLKYADDNPLYYRDSGLFRLAKRATTRLEDPTGKGLTDARVKREELRDAGKTLNHLPENLPFLLDVYRTNLREIRNA